MLLLMRACTSRQMQRHYFRMRVCRCIHACIYAVILFMRCKSSCLLFLAAATAAASGQESSTEHVILKTSAKEKCSWHIDPDKRFSISPMRLKHVARPRILYAFKAIRRAGCLNCEKGKVYSVGSEPRPPARTNDW